VKVQHSLVSTLPGELPKQITSIVELKECLRIVKSWKLCPGITDSKFATFNNKNLPQDRDNNVTARIENNPQAIRAVRYKEQEPF
jgi:hypothetical protein